MPTQLSVPFYGSNLIVTENNGTPYIPMKPIVEGIGLAWQSQHRKLSNDTARWGVTMMVIPSLDKDKQSTLHPTSKTLRLAPNTST